MYGASVDIEYSVYPSYNGIKSELYYRTFIVLFLKISHVLFSVFLPKLFPEFFGKRFLEFLPKSLKNSIGIISRNSIPTILNPWAVSVWQHWRMYGLPVWRIKSPAGIFSHIHICASGCESLIQKENPGGLARVFSESTVMKLWKNFLYYFLIFYFCLFFYFFIGLSSCF